MGVDDGDLPAPLGQVLLLPLGPDVRIFLGLGLFLLIPLGFDLKDPLVGTLGELVLLLLELLPRHLSQVGSWWTPPHRWAGAQGTATAWPPFQLIPPPHRWVSPPPRGEPVRPGLSQLNSQGTHR